MKEPYLEAKTEGHKFALMSDGIWVLLARRGGARQRGLLAAMFDGVTVRRLGKDWYIPWDFVVTENLLNGSPEAYQRIEGRLRKLKEEGKAENAEN